MITASERKRANTLVRKLARREHREWRELMNLSADVVLECDAKSNQRIEQSWQRMMRLCDGVTAQLPFAAIRERIERGWGTTQSPNPPSIKAGDIQPPLLARLEHWLAAASLSTVA